MPAYSEKFQVGTAVQIADASVLKRFHSTWHLHNSLVPEQLAWAGRRAVVSEVGFYHGGDPLYMLQGMPGVWHEGCLTPITDRAP